MARKQGSTTDNVSHLFAEMDPDQPATAIVNFVSKVMISSQKRWTLPAALLSGGLLFCSVWILLSFCFSFCMFGWEDVCMCEEGLFGRQWGRGTEEVQCGCRRVKYRGEVIFISLGGDVEMMLGIFFCSFLKKKEKVKKKKKRWWG